MKHTILFLAANPLGTDRLALDREARAIQAELERSGFRDSFLLETRWATEPLDLLRALRKLRPTVVHFSGHGSSDGGRARRGAAGPHRDVVVEDDPAAPGQRGLYFQGSDGRPQLVSGEALAHVFDAAGSSVKLVVLNACYSEPQAAALLPHVDCVIGMQGSIRDDAARSFAIGFYGGLGERESVAAAYKQGCAAIDLEGLADRERPQLQSRQGIDAAQLVLASPQTTRPRPADASAGVSRHVEPSSRLRRASWGSVTAIAVAAAIYVGMPTRPTLRVDSVETKHLTSVPDKPQQVRLVLMRTVIDGKLGDRCLVQVSENRAFAGARGDVLEGASGVVEDEVPCEADPWEFPFQLARRPHIDAWRGWVRIALRRGNRIFESEPVAVEATTTAQAQAPTQKEAMQ